MSKFGVFYWLVAKGRYILAHFYGTGTIAQVGNIVKTSIAYLGDVMNTCYRIEGECNSYGKDFLISDNLAVALGGEDQYEFIGEIIPRGKTESIKLYSPLKNTSKVDIAS